MVITKELDPKNYVGYERRAVMRLLHRIAESKDGKYSKQKRYDAITILLREADKEIFRYNLIKRKQIVERQTVIDEAITEYKLRKKMSFYSRHADKLQGEWTAEMYDEFNRLEQAEKFGCYELRGITPFRKDCNLCPKMKECLGVSKSVDKGVE